MSTNAIQPSRRSEVTAPLIALVLAVTILVIGAQVSTFWGSRTSAPTQPTTAVFIPTSSDASGSLAHLPAACRPKVGC
jgi:hypothetical protein